MHYTLTCRLFCWHARCRLAHVLPDSIRCRLGYLLAKTHQRQLKLFEAHTHDLSVSGRQYATLLALEANAELRQSDLAEWLDALLTPLAGRVFVSIAVDLNGKAGAGLDEYAGITGPCDPQDARNSFNTKVLAPVLHRHSPAFSCGDGSSL